MLLATTHVTRIVGILFDATATIDQTRFAFLEIVVFSVTMATTVALGWNVHRLGHFKEFLGQRASPL